MLVLQLTFVSLNSSLRKHTTLLNKCMAGLRCTLLDICHNQMCIAYATKSCTFHGSVNKAAIAVIGSRNPNSSSVNSIRSVAVMGSRNPNSSSVNSTRSVAVMGSRNPNSSSVNSKRSVAVTGSRNPNSSSVNSTRSAAVMGSRNPNSSSVNSTRSVAVMGSCDTRLQMYSAL